MIKGTGGLIFMIDEKVLGKDPVKSIDDNEFIFIMEYNLLTNNTRAVTLYVKCLQSCK